MINDEEWEIITSYPRYEISNYGRVRSNIGKSKILKLYKHKHGYLYVDLNNKYGRQRFTISRLVYAHFGSEEMTDDLMVDHKDENKSNNYIGNLQLLTNQENINKHWSFTKGWIEQQEEKIIIKKDKKLIIKNYFRSKKNLKDKLTIKISRKEYNNIYKLCKKENVNVTEFIYNAIDYYLKKEEPFLNSIKNDDWIFD